MLWASAPVPPMTHCDASMTRGQTLFDGAKYCRLIQKTCNLAFNIPNTLTLPLGTTIAKVSLTKHS